MKIESYDIVFLNESQKNISFSGPFLSQPSISATSLLQNVELFVSNLTNTGFTLNSSSRFSGNVKIIVVGE